jgi:nucleotide-binding universal stress UspA family protein
MNASPAVIPIVPAIQVVRILYATDFSEASRAALPLVTAIARQYGSKVYIAHIWSPLPSSMVTPESAPMLEDKQEGEGQIKAWELGASAELAGLRTSVIVEPGDPVEELNRIVRVQC